MFDMVLAYDWVSLLGIGMFDFKEQTKRLFSFSPHTGGTKI
jgi:hypothetical protein